MGFSKRASRSDGRSRSTGSRGTSWLATGRKPIACGTSGVQSATSCQQSMLFVEGIRAPAGLPRQGGARASTPICPDTSLPCSAECGPGGWSARMFLHQMLQTSWPRWTCSDTALLLSKSTPRILRLRIGGGSSLSDVLETSPPAWKRLYLTPRMIRWMLKHKINRRRGLNVLQRTPGGWRKIRLSGSSMEDCVASPPKNGKPSKDSLGDGLRAYLSRAVASCSEMRSACLWPGGSRKE